MFESLLELGGRTNIFADMTQAVPQSVRAAFANQGQICLCGSRVFVEKSAVNSWIDQFVERTRSLKVGDPLDPATEFGAVTSKQHYDKIMGYIDLAKREGGEILCGGGRPSQLPERCRNGYFIEPTVISGLDSKCRVNQEEIFGPVVTIMPFEDDAKVIEMANSVEYGECGRNLDRGIVLRRNSRAEPFDQCWLVRDLRVPFGGMKASGVGREGGEETIRFFTEPKNVCIAINP
jgi:aminomuconate-semialdehyde/2-hydroxymuconate-6-semialdehyde dehydrogenase